MAKNRGEDGFLLKCKNCGGVTKLSQYSSWCFIIMRQTKCDTCNKQIPENEWEVLED